MERARIRESGGQADAALEFYKQLLGGRPAAPFFIDALLGAARLREARGELAMALKQYETALLQFPDDVRAPEVRLQIQRLRQLRAAGGEG